MLKKVPDFLYEILLKQYGEQLTKKIVEGYSKRRFVTLRVNTIKSNIEHIKENLNEHGFKFREVKWNKEALIIEDVDENQIRKLDIYNNGEIYLQSLSSMLPAIILNPKSEENILDMTAAPGGKTTQMAAISSNKALITACEKNKIRSERLKYNIEKQGANRINVLVEDARKLDNFFSFDKILLDAPCSGSGTLNLMDEKLEKFFNKELINRSINVQIELLKKAISILKPNGEIIYSTCSILKEENEENILKILKNNNNIEIVPIDQELIEDIPLLPVSIKGTVCICPDELYEGFFVCKLRKNK